MEDWNRKGRSGVGKFGLGVLTGALVTALVICGTAGVWKVFSGIRNGDYTSASTVSETDVNEKLDQINSLIEEYYLYEDEIDEDTLIDGIYSGYAEALEIHIQNITMRRRRKLSMSPQAVNSRESVLQCPRAWTAVRSQ